MLLPGSAAPQQQAELHLGLAQAEPAAWSWPNPMHPPSRVLLVPSTPALGTLVAAGGRKQQPSLEGEKTPEECSNLAPLIT